MEVASSFADCCDPAVAIGDGSVLSGFVWDGCALIEMLSGVVDMTRKDEVRLLLCIPDDDAQWKKIDEMGFQVYDASAQNISSKGSLTIRNWQLRLSSFPY